MTRNDGRARRVLMVVDVQNDFCEGGALGVEGGRAVATGVAALLTRGVGEYDAVVVSTDHHRGDTDNGGHFALEAVPDFLDTWPPHCVVGTPGAALDPSVAQALEAIDDVPVIRIRKGWGVPAYAATEGSTGRPERGEAGATLPDLVREHGWADADVVGLALDYCVRATAEGLADLGMSVRVLPDLTAAVHPEGRDEVLAGLRRRGIEIADRSAAPPREDRS